MTLLFIIITLTLALFNRESAATLAALITISVSIIEAARIIKNALLGNAIMNVAASRIKIPREKQP